MENNFWESTIKLPAYPSLTTDIETEVLVIGGGICGILCAYRLAICGKKVVLVEGDTIASHKTKRSTAVVTALQDVFYSDLKKTIGEEKAKLFLKANLEAVREYRKLAEDFDFDLENVPSYKYFINDKNKLIEELLTIRKLGFPAEIVEKEIDTDPIAGAILFPEQCQINPLKLIAHLTPYFDIYEHSKILKIKDRIAFTNKHQIKAKHIIVATGYPFLKFKGMFFYRLTQKKSYVMTIPKPEDVLHGNVISSVPSQIYFRDYNNSLIIGGSDSVTGNCVDGYAKIKDYIEKHYVNTPITFQWVNQDCVTVDQLPYIGKYGSKQSNNYVATGFNLWGFTGSMLSSMVLTDLILNKPNPYVVLFSPKRRSPFQPVYKNVKTAVCNLICFRKKRCTHLGCALIWNEQDGKYECPCHGSKYMKDGTVLEGPAQSNKE